MVLPTAQGVAGLILMPSQHTVSTVPSTPTHCTPTILQMDKHTEVLLLELASSSFGPSQILLCPYCHHHHHRYHHHHHQDHHHHHHQDHHHHHEDDILLKEGGAGRDARPVAESLFLPLPLYLNRPSHFDDGNHEDDDDDDDDCQHVGANFLVPNNVNQPNVCSHYGDKQACKF